MNNPAQGFWLYNNDSKSRVLGGVQFSPKVDLF